MNQIQTEVIFLNLLRQADEFVFAILGTSPTADAGSFRARVASLYNTFQADKPAFVASSVQIGFLATLIKEYAAFRKSEITQIGTPEILIGQVRWEDIYDKPDILAASSDWADITNKPATFTPTAHAHDYASITEKPATFAPRLTQISYTGNGTATRVLSFSGGFMPTGGVWSNHNNLTCRILNLGEYMTNVTTSTITTSLNANGAQLRILLFG